MQENWDRIKKKSTNYRHKRTRRNPEQRHRKYFNKTVKENTTNLRKRYLLRYKGIQKMKQTRPEKKLRMTHYNQDIKCT